MFLVSWIIKLNDWGGRRSSIGVVGLEECLGVCYCFIGGIHNICFSCINVEQVIGSRVLNFLPGFLHLKLHCFWFKGDRIHDMGDVLTEILEDGVEHCILVYVHG